MAVLEFWKEGMGTFERTEAGRKRATDVTGRE